MCDQRIVDCVFQLVPCICEHKCPLLDDDEALYLPRLRCICERDELSRTFGLDLDSRVRFVSSARRRAGQRLYYWTTKTSKNAGKKYVNKAYT
jgi:hypothetical protein